MDQMFRVIVDGTPWMDPDGHMQWPEGDANALAGLLESEFDDVNVIPA